MKFVFFLLYLCPLTALSQSFNIGIINLYGNRAVKEMDIKGKLPFKEGDTLDSTFQQDVVARNLQTIPGVKKATVNIVCCDDKTGKNIVFVGIAENDSNSFQYNPAPGKPVHLPAAILAVYDSLENAIYNAVLNGRSAEDHKYGYSWAQDSATRKWQQECIILAARYQPQLINALRQAKDNRQRMAAAQVLAYANDKTIIIKELLHAVRDPDEAVRNNATRALGVLADYIQQTPGTKLTIPAAPFINMINSLVWTDRNKAGMVLFFLCMDKNNKQVLEQLKKQALPSLAEMAAWKNPGHAMMAYFIVAQIAGEPTEEAFKHINMADKNEYLATCLQKIQHP
ncbi:MAG: HEAT repeat domain-containing protein [Chitinophagaceae bacterium]